MSPLERLAQIYPTLPYGGAILMVTPEGAISNGIQLIDRFPNRVIAIRELRRLGWTRHLDGWKLVKKGEGQMKHTPVPWTVSRNNAGAIPLHFQPPEVLGRGGNCCVAAQLGNGPEAEANAEFIVRACNCHEELLAALEFAYAHCDPTPGREEEWRCIPAAIDKAKGKV